MSKLDDSVLTPYLGEQVLKVLSRYQTLPDWGILAGQAVSSAIDEVLGTGAPVYNDIDWFVPRSEWSVDDATGRKVGLHVPERRGKRVGADVTYSVQEDVVSDSYERTLCVAQRSLYTVIYAEDIGMLNKVAVDWAYARDGGVQNRAIDLIRVFDTNNVQASVDLKTGFLTVTPEYREFFRTRQLQIASTFTPIQSLLRYLKKADELKGVYADRKRALDMVTRLMRANEGSKELVEMRQDSFREGKIFVGPEQLSRHRCKGTGDLTDVKTNWLKSGEGVWNAPLSFGAKYRKHYERFAEFLEPSFSLTERNRGKLWLCSARDTALPQTFALGALQKAHPTRAPQFHLSHILPAGKLVSKRRELFETFVGLVEEGHKQSKYLEVYGIQGDDYLDGLDSDRTMRELARVALAHTELFWATVALPMRRQIEAMRTLRRHFKKHNLPEAWGVLRGVGSSQMKEWLADEQLIDAEFKKLEGTRDPLIARFPLPAVIGEVEVVQLLSQFDLNHEGVKMSHCVAGYGSAMKEHQCRIVSFRSGLKATEWATGEWTFQEDHKAAALEDLGDGKFTWPVKLSLSQLRSHANTAPTENLRLAEEEARRLVNEWLRGEGLAGWEFVRPGYYATMRDSRLKHSATRKAAPARRVFDELDDDLPF